MNSGGNGPVKARNGPEYKYVETRWKAKWSVCTLNTCKKQLSNWCFCLTATSLLTQTFPSKALLALGVKTIIVQNTTIAVFLQELRVGIKSASSARWAYFFLLLLLLQSNVYTSPYHTGEHESLRVTGAKDFSYTCHTTVTETFELNSFQLTLHKFKALKIFHFQLSGML